MQRSHPERHFPVSTRMLGQENINDVRQNQKSEPKPSEVAAEIDLIVRDLHEESLGVKIKAKSDWTIGDVKRALVQKLGRQDIGSIVRRLGPFRQLVTLAEDEPLGRRRKLLLHGPLSPRWSEEKRESKSKISQDSPTKRIIDVDRAVHTKNPAEALGLMQEPGREIVVTVRHALQGGDVQVACHSTATMGQLKSALACKFGDSNLMSRVRFVRQHRSGAHILVRDGEELGQQRELLLVGFDFGPPSAGMVASPHRVALKVKHAIGNGELRIQAWNTWTMYDIKRAIAQKLGRSAIVDQSRFVQATSDDYSTLLEVESLGDRCELLFLGADLPQPVQSQGVDVPAGRKKGSPRPSLESSTSKPQMVRPRPPSESSTLQPRVKANLPPPLQASTSQPQKEVPSQPANSLLPTLNDVLAFLGSVLLYCSSSQYQQMLGWGQACLEVVQQSLFAEACAAAASEIGHQANEACLLLMLDAIESHLSDPSVKALSQEVETVLLLPPGALFGSSLKQCSGTDPQKPAKPADTDTEVTIMQPQKEPNSILSSNTQCTEKRTDQAGQTPREDDLQPANARKWKEVRLTVTHAYDEEQVRVTVPENATMLDIKMAMASKLCKQDVVDNGRIVKRIGKSNVFVELEDTQQLTSQKRLFFLGTGFSMADESNRHTIRQESGQLKKSVKSKTAVSVKERTCETDDSPVLPCGQQ